MLEYSYKALVSERSELYMLVPKRFMPLVVIIGLLSLTFSAFSQDFATKTLKEGKISLDVPTSWSVEEFEDSILIYPPGDEIIGMLVYLFDLNADLNERKRGVIQEIKGGVEALSEPKLIETGKVTLGNTVEAVVEKYSFGSQGGKKGFIYLYLGKTQNLGFMLAVLCGENACDKYRDLMEKVINSVRFSATSVAQGQSVVPSGSQTTPMSSLPLGWTSYDDPNGYFSVGVPPGWYYNPTPNPNIPVGIPYVNYIYVEGSRISADFSIVVETVPVGYTLQGYAAAVEMNSLSRFRGYSKYSEAPINVRGRTFIKRSFTINMTYPTGEEIPIYAEQYYYLSTNLAYTISFEAMLSDYQRFLPFFNAIIETFQPLK